jgi:hypothetical protein
VNALLVAPLVLLSGLGMPSVATVPTPPPSWTQERVLECDGGTVRTYLTPAGFGTPFHLVGSTGLIIPRYVEVVLPTGEGPYVTVDVPGFDAGAESAVHCWYVDPVGLEVELWGVRR